jgi:hypothetical protein
MTMKTVVGQLTDSNAVESGDNLFRIDDLGGAIPRGLSSIRYAARIPRGSRKSRRS